MTTVSSDDIRTGVRTLDLSGRALCVHSSLRSFGHIQGGAQTVIQGLLDEGCTIVVPTFTSAFTAPPPPDRTLTRNGIRGDIWPDPDSGRVYNPETTDVDADMGAIPCAIAHMPERQRGNHPLNSFTAIGPLARELVAEQAPLRVYAPLQALATLDGWTVLMGVSLTRMTMLHLAERMVGRQLFRRWASSPDGPSIEVEVGGCSEGFDNLMPYLSPLMRQAQVGSSRWLAFPIQRTLEAAARAIRNNPRVTHCGDPECERCNDAVQGGPILTV